LLIDFLRGKQSEPVRIAGNIPGEGFHLPHVSAEIANLIQRVPRGHLHGNFLFDIRDRHCHVEHMLFGMFERHAVMDRSVGCGAEREQNQE